MIRVEDLGVIDYAQAWDYQKDVFNKVLESDEYGMLLLCEHPHTYTLGRNGQVNNLLINDSFLESINAKYHHVDRGGDITYHGFGQLVGYPILNLSNLNMGIKTYVDLIEQCIIDTLKTWDINGERISGATGVWIKMSGMQDVKIAAIGIKASRFVTMHGFALNVNTDLSYFNHINPCGFVDKGVCSMKSLTGEDINIQKVKEIFSENFMRLF